MDCNILISLLPERKPLKIASKLGFLAPGLEKWRKVVQARILVKNGRSSTPELGGWVGVKLILKTQRQMELNVLKIPREIPEFA